jgi:hypothetical protein
MSERNSTPSPILGSHLNEDDHDLTASLDLAFDGAEHILRAWRRGMRPDPDLTVSEWADGRILFAETVTAGRGDRLSQTAALATEAAVFRGADAIAAGLADEIANPVTAFHTFAATPQGITPPTRKGPNMTTTPTDTPNPATTAVPPDEATAPTPPGLMIAATAPSTGASAKAAPTQQTAAMTAEDVRAEAAEVAQVCAQAARLGIDIDASDAVVRGLKPEALRARILADLAARGDAAGIIATAPAVAAAKDSPIIAAAKKAAAASH